MPHVDEARDNVVEVLSPLLLPSGDELRSSSCPSCLSLSVVFIFCTAPASTTPTSSENSCIIDSSYSSKGTPPPLLMHCSTATTSPFALFLIGWQRIDFVWNLQRVMEIHLLEGVNHEREGTNKVLTRVPVLV